MIDIRSMDIEEIKGLMTDLGQPKYRAEQVFVWLNKGVASFDEMTNLPANLRDKLKESCLLHMPNILSKLVSKDGTIKYLFELQDGNTVESVLMQYDHGRTLCISCQVGCRMGCTFCASTVGGLVRSLTPAEMLEQILAASKDSGFRVDGIVMMGMGEPLDNYDNVIKFLKLVNHSKGICIGQRHISLSTCGLVPMIDKLSEEDMQITLSISLHSPTDEERKEIMPVTNKWGVSEVVSAARRYANNTGRKIYFEYTMIDGVNDSKEHAKRLGSLIKNMICHVNLIPLNSVDGKSGRGSGRAAIESFQAALSTYGVTSTVRRKLGSDIDAACGQLRRRHGESS